MYKYHVKIRGEKEPIILEGDRGRNLKKAYDDNTIGKSDRISFGDDASYTGDQILGVKRVYIDEGTNNAVNHIREHNQRRREFIALSPEKKSTRTAFFEMLYQASHDRKPSQEEIEKAKSIQLDFYKNNPNRLYPDPKCFADLLPQGKPIITMMGGLLLKYVGAMVSQDLEDVKYHR